MKKAVAFLTDSSLTGTRYLIRQIVLVAASVGFSLCFACAAPLVAFGVFAALTMPFKRALGFIASVWLANQLVGYGLLDYPQNANSFGWGAALGVAALLATATARAVAARFVDKDQPVMIAASFVAAFVVYELALFAAGLAALGGMEGFAPNIVAYVAVLDMAAFAALIGVSRLEQFMLPARGAQQA